MTGIGASIDQREFRCKNCGGKILVPKNLPPTTGPCPHCQREITSPGPEFDLADDPIFGKPVLAGSPMGPPPLPKVDPEVIRAELEAAKREEEAKVEALRLELEKQQALRAEAERLEKERLEAEKAAAARLEAERADFARLEAQRVEAERLEAARLEAEKLLAEKAEAERVEQERLQTEARRLEEERIAAEKAEAERLEREKGKAAAAEVARLAAEKAEEERIEAERVDRERLEAEQAEAERIAAEQAEAERLEREREEAEKAEKAETERIAAEQAEAERMEAERVERERLEAEKAEEERIAAEKAEAERLAAMQAEAERLEREREAAEQARLEAERLEKERQERERQIEEKAAAARAELEKVEAARLELLRLEQQRAEALRLEEEKAEAARREAQRIQEEAERLEMLDRQQLEASRAARAAKEAAERAEAERLEAERDKARRADEARAAVDREKTELLERMRQQGPAALAAEIGQETAAGEEFSETRPRSAGSMRSVTPVNLSKFDLPVSRGLGSGASIQPPLAEDLRPVPGPGAEEVAEISAAAEDSQFYEAAPEVAVEPSELAEPGIPAAAAGAKRRAPVKSLVTMLLLLAAAGGVYWVVANKAGQQVGQPAVDPAVAAAIREEQYLESGWEADAREQLRAFLAADRAAGKAARSIRGSELLAEMEAFYAGGPIDDSDTPESAFAVYPLTPDDRKRGIFMLEYDQPPVFELGEFFTPLSPLDIQYGVREPDMLLSTVARMNNFTGEPLRVHALFRRGPDGLRIDWETFIQTKYRTLRSFLEIPEPGRKGVFRVFIMETVPERGRAPAGTRTYQIFDPAQKEDSARVNVAGDSRIGQALSILNWRGTKETRATARTATLELEWSDDPTPELRISRFICWEFLGVGGEEVGKR